MPAYFTPPQIIRICWIIFVAVWIAASVSTKRTVYRESTAQRVTYSLLLVAGFYLIARGYRLDAVFGLRALYGNALVGWIAAALCCTGLVFSIWARLTLGRNWSGTVTLKEEHELIERGPYRIVRHPIYTGLLAMIIATAVAVGHIIGFAGVLLAFFSFWIKLGYEEKVLLNQFPDQYAAYQKRVKRIIPLIL